MTRPRKPLSVQGSSQAWGAEQAPSRQVLARLPGRVLSFLHAAGTWPAVGRELRAAGFGAAEHAEGMRLLTAVTAYRLPEQPDREHDAKSRAAQQEIEAWVKLHFARLQLTLARLHPGEPSPFRDIEAPRGPHALPALGTLLSRLRSLERAGASAQPGWDGSGVVDSLARRGLHRDERERLELLLKLAQSAPDPSESPLGRDPRRREHLELLAWYREWATTARSLIRNRHHLTALGLTCRAPHTVADEGAADEDVEKRAADDDAPASN